jgi:peptidyl-prolyl cis-trans isomerase SurA
LVQLSPQATPEQVEAARQKALALAAEARRPGVDFAALAKEKSEGPSKADGGDLGFFRRGVMEASFDKAAFSTPQGGVSDPVRSKFGWHVVYVEERRALAVPTFDEVKEKLREKMQQAQLEKYTEQYVQELRAAALVEVKL